MQKSSPAPTGPRASRQSNRLAASRQPNRGGIQKRNASAARVDRDGDLVMEPSSTGARGGRAKGNGSGAAIRGAALRGAANISRRATPETGRRAPRTGIDTAAIQKAVLRDMGSNESVPKGGRSRTHGARGRENTREARDSLQTMTILGLKDSKAASNRGGGISELIAWLERKATHPDAPSREAVRIKKSRMEGDALIISVRSEDVSKIERLNNFDFAGAQLKIESEGQPATQSETPNTVELLKGVLSRRYNVEAKLLDLSQLGSDPDLVNVGMFNSTSRESKFFPALMKICDGLFKSAKEKEDAVVSVTLASNALSEIAPVTTLSQTFPSIRNLDLSNNTFASMKSLEGWRWKFRKLDHLILSGNPVEQTEPKYKEDLLKWYPTLTTINTVPVRAPEEVTTTMGEKLPLPILGPSFRDEASITENFVKQFFLGYDKDRVALANGYYDNKSTFSLSINTSAPRAPEDSAKNNAVGWEQYIKRSRNLLKVTHPPARSARMFTGTEAIRDCFSTLPATRHPDLIAEPQKWCIECHTIPGLPDPAGQSLSGVGGLMVMIHGEFAEVDGSTDRTAVTRSFDRTFVLGPGGGMGGIRVATDTLVLRAYGGFEAWKPEETEASSHGRAATAQQQIQIPTPQGWAVPGNGKTDEQAGKERLTLTLSEFTGMTLEYSAMCLEQSNWNLDGAAVAFEQAKAQLPPEAFVIRK